MNSREIVKRTFHYESPSRLAISNGRLGISDFSGPAMKGPSRQNFPAGADEWGLKRERTHIPNMGQVVEHPLEDIRGLENYPMPDFTDDSRYEGTLASFEAAEQTGKYMSGFFHLLFELMHQLHGFENTLLDLYADRPAMEALADRIVDVRVTQVNEFARRFPGRLDGWIATDDWGTQTAAFVSFDLWMDFFCPRYKRIFDAMHAAGCDVVVHSCGRTNEIIEGLIQAGADVMNLMQPRVLGIEEIGRRYRGRVAFESLADIQTTLPSGDRRQVAADVEALMTHWACREGGLVALDYDDTSIGTPDPTLNRFMYDQFSEWSEKIYGEPLPLVPAPETNHGG